MKSTAIIASGGSGIRFGSDIPKQYLELCGIPVFIRTLKVIDNVDNINNIIIALDPNRQDFVKEQISKYGIRKRIDFVNSGKERYDTVYNAIKCKNIQSSEIILIHDAVRPLASTQLFINIIEATDKYGAAVPGLLPKETIKSIDGNFVKDTIDRNNLRNIQTPQGFRKDILIDSYNQMNVEDVSITDDASIVEQSGYPVHIIQGEEFNIKITTPLDMIFAETYISNTKKDK
jgi:2-C-methyl-D-erythritol 4-phosphate cytidylyltransferase